MCLTEFFLLSTICLIMYFVTKYAETKYGVILMVDICLLGCGGMMPLPERRLTAMLFRYKGRLLLIDCGEGTQIPIKLAGWGFKAIEAILFTHYHGDHVAGLPGLLMTMGNSGREEPLTIIGPTYLCEVIKGLCVIVPTLPFEINLIELPEEITNTINLGEIEISTLPLEHSMPCVAYCIEVKRPGKFNGDKAISNNIPMECWSRLQRGENIEYDNRLLTPDMVLGEKRKGIKVVYCTDSRPAVGLSNFAKDSQLLILEGMYGDNDMLSKAIEKQHMLFSEAAEIAKSSNSKELWLTHFSPSLKDPQEYLKNASCIFPNTLIGKELMFKTLKYED